MGEGGGRREGDGGVGVKHPKASRNPRWRQLPACLHSDPCTGRDTVTFLEGVVTEDDRESGGTLGCPRQK